MYGMSTDKKINKQPGQTGDKIQQEPGKKTDQDINRKALNEAQKDIDLDADMGTHSHNPNDDLDEGESARLGEDKNDLA